MKHYLTSFIIPLLLLAGCRHNADQQSPDPSDSLLTVTAAYDIAYDNLDSARWILDQMRSRKLANPWTIDHTEGRILNNANELEQAVTYYERAMSYGEVRADDELMLSLLLDIADAHRSLGNSVAATKYLKELLSRAHDSGEKFYESEALAGLGMQLVKQGDRKKGFEYCLKAIELMPRDGEEDDWIYSLCFDYYTLLGQLYNQKQYEEALPLLEEYAQLLSEHGRKMGPYYEKELSRCNTYQACFYQKLGMFERADSAYRAYCQLPEKARSGMASISAYLLERGQWAEAAKIIRHMMDFLEESGQHYTTGMRATYYNMAIADSGLNDFHAAFDHMSEAYEISDTIAKRQAAANAEELEAIYQNQTKQKEIDLRNLWLAILGGVILIVLTSAVLLFRHNRTIRRKNRLMAQAIDEMIVYREAMMHAEKEHETSNNEVPTDEPDEEAERRIFLQLDQLLDSEQLYLNPSLCRNDLCKLVNIDKNQLGRILKRYSPGANSQVYINRKRIQHAIILMRQHPNWTMQAVAEGCGMTNTTTFYRSFRQTYGMTPTEYMNSLSGNHA